MEVTFPVATEYGGVWVHGQPPSSASELGFRAIICIDSKPILPPSLGLPSNLETYRNTVFLQTTHGPNEMFSRWDDPSNHKHGLVPKMMTIGLDEYLALLQHMRTYWKEVETNLMAKVNQLNNMEPVLIYPNVSYYGHGTCTYSAKIGSRLVFQASLESRHVARANGIKVWLEQPTLEGNEDASAGNLKDLEIPCSTLLAMANCEDFCSDLFQKWVNSHSVAAGGNSSSSNQGCGTPGRVQSNDECCR